MGPRLHEGGRELVVHGVSGQLPCAAHAVQHLADQGRSRSCCCLAPSLTGPHLCHRPCNMQLRISVSADGTTTGVQILQAKR